MSIQEINDLIDQAVNPLGGDPKIKGPDLNSLLKTLSAEFDAGSGSPSSWAALSAAIEAQRTRLDTLVTGAPQALDTLAEIAAQLAADEVGAAAILATQQQHTQQLANVVHRTGDETITGHKTFSDNVGIGTAAPSERLDVQGKVKATQFIGDGSQLTNLPTNAAPYQRTADSITADYVRTYYLNAQSAINGAGTGGTTNIYSLAYGAVNPSDPTTTVPGLEIPGVDLSINMMGLAMNTPDANTDVLTFVGPGKQVVNGNRSVITTFPIRANTGAGWTINANNTWQVYDVTINDLDIVLSGVYSWAFWLRAPGKMRYSGDITARRNLTNNNVQHIIYNERIAFEGKGRLDIYGNDKSLYANGVKPAISCVLSNFLGSITWEGDIVAHDDVHARHGGQPLNGANFIKLRNGTLDLRDRYADAQPFWSIIGQAAFAHLILDNYTVVADPNVESITTGILTLVGNTWLSGRINALEVIDLRPPGLRGQGLPWKSGPATTAVDINLGLENTGGATLVAPAGKESATAIRLYNFTEGLRRIRGFTSPRLRVYANSYEYGGSPLDALTNDELAEPGAILLENSGGTFHFGTGLDFVELQQEVNPRDPTSSVWVELNRKQYSFN